MQLTRYSDYSLRVLTYLAVRPAQSATIEGIAQSYDISRAHLMKVVNGLGRAGFIDTRRGRGGGFRLSRPPESIAIGEVIRATEGNQDFVECFSRTEGNCRIESVCGLKGILESALEAFFETLDQYTLADLVARRRKPLETLLNIA